MGSCVRLAAVALVIFLLAPTLVQALEPVPPIGRCQSWQSRCAMAAGGKCDPVTGRWSVSARLMTGYLACIDLGQRRNRR